MMETVAHNRSDLRFRLDPEAKALIAVATPGPASQSIDEAWLRDELVAQGYGALRYLPRAALPLLANYNSGKAVEVKIAECIDASLKIDTSPDGLEAYLDINAAEGGAPLTRDVVMTALAEYGIGAGIVPEAIDAAIAAGAVKRHVVAYGLPPEHGCNGRLESLLPEVRNRTPHEDETGHTDYRDLGEIPVVHPGAALMLLHPPTLGTPGLSVLGEQIDAKPGKEVKYAANLPGTSLDPDNPDLLRAAINGQPVIIRGGMMVEPVFRINAVNTASGNIDFDGSVVIKGDISAGMAVHVSGDIEIGGVVETATLEAGGSIVVKGGVMGGLGRKTTEEHHIRCAGCFNAAYAQQARIEAGDSIFIDDMAMQCELTAINHIQVGNKRRGHIIGGHVQATFSITAKVFGSPNRVRTTCTIGVNPLMHKQMLELSKTRDGQETQLLEISKLLDFSRKNPGKLRPEMIDKAQATAAALSSGIAALREEEETLAKKIELSQQSRVNVQQAIHEGVEIHMGKQCYRVTGEHGPCSVGLGEAGLELLPLEVAK
ncbi:MAG: FapA family protein [Rhodocyclaceae bacterium]|nr:FapA family protein [Rhodocyclaceae bacterium]